MRHGPSALMLMSVACSRTPPNFAAIDPAKRSDSWALLRCLDVLAGAAGIAIAYAALFAFYSGDAREKSLSALLAVDKMRPMMVCLS
jgi:hypothetical protein